MDSKFLHYACDLEDASVSPAKIAAAAMKDVKAAEDDLIRRALARFGISDITAAAPFLSASFSMDTGQMVHMYQRQPFIIIGRTEHKQQGNRLTFTIPFRAYGRDGQAVTL